MLIDNRDGLPRGDSDSPVLITGPREGIPPLVDTQQALQEAADRLVTGTQPVALDVERAQGFRYGADPFLVQVRREDVGTFLIDTHALPDLSVLAPGMREVWLLHDAEQDLPNLAQVGLHPQTLFDTEVAARLVGMDHFGLAAVCEQVLGLALVKDHQASDWSVRPLPPDWLRYAALDVELLTELYRRLSLSLHDLGRWEWALEEFDHVMAHPAPAPKPDRWRSLPGAGKITSRRSLGVLRELWEARDAVAREIDLSPGRLVRNAALVRAAQQPPRNRRSLLSISEFRSPVARQYTDTWLRAINRAVTADDSELPARRIPVVPGSVPDARHWAHLDPDAFLRLKAVRAAAASVGEELGLSSEVVLEPRDQRFLAWAPLDPSMTPEDAVAERLEESDARPWQRTLVSAPLCAALTEPHQFLQDHPRD
ncbi:MAG: HRDC domain-containing protein [Propionibacterium sp.]|nr:HRDC domain-containing protein [Propionibacterium sp.]